MISTETEGKLCELIFEIAKAEKEIEVYRSELAESLRFEPYAAFTRLDKHRMGYISALDIVNFLEYTYTNH
jgi:hypothetical protein